MSFFDFGNIGIDLGTANVRFYQENKGVVLNEPSVIAVERGSGKLIAAGEEARSMLGRTPANIEAVRPLKHGVILSFHDTERMLKYFINKMRGKRLFFKPKAVVCVPSGVTEVEKRSVIQAVEDAGIRHAFLMEETIAAAIGAGLDIGAAHGNIVMDIGAGTSDIAVISLGSVVVSDSLKTAGDAFNEAIVHYIRKVHNVLIGESTAEQVKINIGTAIPEDDEKSLQVSGRDIVSGLPKTIRITSNDTAEALKGNLDKILNMLLAFLERVPPELSVDIFQNGIYLTGGSSLLRHIDALIAEKTGLQCRAALKPMSCTAIGAGVALANIDLYSKSAVQDYRTGEYYQQQ